MTKFPIYILTLDSRTDRQDRIKNALDELQMDYKFIYSRKKDNEKFAPLPLANQIEVAIWNSHACAMRNLLSTNHEWALILEDDAIIDEVSSDFMNRTIIDYLSVLGKHFGIVQIGWIPNSEKHGFQAFLAKIFRKIFGLNRFDLKSRVNYFAEIGLMETWEVTRYLSKVSKQRIVPLIGMRLGTHAYLINRKACAELIQRFENRHLVIDFKTIDQDLLSLTQFFEEGSAINAVRFNKSFVGQLQVDSDNINKTVY